MSEVERLRELFTVENFKAWLATKDPNEQFEYQSNVFCASAQFIQAHGFVEGRAGGHYVRTGEGDPSDFATRVEYPDEIYHAYGRFRENVGNTFGELLFELNSKKGV